MFGAKITLSVLRVRYLKANIVCEREPISNKVLSASIVRQQQIGAFCLRARLTHVPQSARTRAISADTMGLVSAYASTSVSRRLPSATPLGQPGDTWRHADAVPRMGYGRRPLHGVDAFLTFKQRGTVAALAAARTFNAVTHELPLTELPAHPDRCQLRSSRSLASMVPHSQLLRPPDPKRRRGAWELNLLRAAAYSFEDASAADRLPPSTTSTALSTESASAENGDRVERLRAALTQCEAMFGAGSPAVAPLLCELACALAQRPVRAEATDEAVALGQRAAASLTDTDAADTAADGTSANAAADGTTTDAVLCGTSERAEGGDGASAAVAAVGASRADVTAALRGLADLAFVLEARGQHLDAAAIMCAARAAACGACAAAMPPVLRARVGAPPNAECHPLSRTGPSS